MVADKAGFIANAANRAGAIETHRLHASVMRAAARHARLRAFRVFARRVGGGTQTAASDLRLRLLREPEALSLCVEPALDLAPSKIRAAYARGDLCVGAFHGADVLGYCWFAFTAAPHMDRVWLDFPSDVVYTYKSFVRPMFRGRGIAAAMYRFADAAATDRGRRRAIICVESHNWPSIAAARRGGFSEAGYAAYVGATRLRSWCSREAARHGLRFFIPS
jgi:GNAT superfamily N-acetyltransferase